MRVKRTISGRNAARALMLAVAFAVLPFSAAAQERMIELPIETMTAHDVIDAVQGQTDYLFTTNCNTALDALNVKVTKKQQTVKSILESLLADSGLKYRMSGNYIIITEMPAVQKVVAAPAAPRTADAYIGSDVSDIGAAPLRIQHSVPAAASAPVVETPKVPEDPIVSAANLPPVSRYEPVSRYAATQNSLPVFVLKTNLLYGGALLTPNLGFEVGLGRRTSLELAASYNSWNLKGSFESNKKLAHWIVKPGFRYWLCERFNGHFFGADLIFARYNIGTHDVPLLFEREHRYYGIAYGGGINYGYHVMLGKRWGLEFVVGAGVLFFDYDRYDCAVCSRTSTPGKKTYFGLTNIGINLVFLIK